VVVYRGVRPAHNTTKSDRVGAGDNVCTLCRPRAKRRTRVCCYSEGSGLFVVLERSKGSFVVLERSEGPASAVAIARGSALRHPARPQAKGTEGSYGSQWPICHSQYRVIQRTWVLQFPAANQRIPRPRYSRSRIRGVPEREANRRTIKLGLRSRFGNEQLFVINAFALGPGPPA
jgi:hypothetical protein